MNLTGLEIQVPIALPSASNLREHWGAKARRVLAQRRATALSFKALMATRETLLALPVRISELMPVFPLAVTLTRQSPRKLDDDNLRGAFKAVRDEVAAQLGVDDGSALVEWRYAQVKGEACVWIRFENATVAHDVAPGRTNATKPGRGRGLTSNVAVKGSSKLAPNLVRSRKERA